MKTTETIFALAVAALLAAGARAQEPGTEPVEPTEREQELIRPIMESPTHDPAQEMIELFHRVERNLVEVDGLLYDASAGQASLSGARDSGMGELLRGGMQRSEGAIQTIDEILRLAQEQGGSVSSCMNAKEESSGAGESPLDRQPQGSPQEREQTPERPSGNQEEPQQPQEGDGQPESPAEEPPGDPQNREAAPPAARATEPGATPFGQDQWGDLPEHVREVFRTEGQSDMPPQYRDWIESYYKRLSKRRE